MVSGSSLFRFAAESARSVARGREPPIASGSRCVALVADGRLKVQWSYSKHFHDAATISTVASRYVDALRELVDHCVDATDDQPDAVRLRARRSRSVGARSADRAVPDADRRLPADADAAAVLLDGRRRSVAGIRAVGIPARRSRSMPDRLRDAWRQVVARHPILRTAFAQVGAAKPHQVVLDHVEMPWHVEDWRGSHAGAAGRTRCASSSPPIICSAFDLGEPPLMRIALLRTGEAEHRLIWSTHHLLVDGWSWPLIFSELSALYAVGRCRRAGSGLRLSRVRRVASAARRGVRRRVLARRARRRRGSDADSGRARESRDSTREAAGEVGRLPDASRRRRRLARWRAVTR